MCIRDRYSSDHGANFTHSNNVSSDTGACTVGNRIAANGPADVYGGTINSSVFSTVKSLAADKVLGCVFYYYEMSNGSFHVSTDYGETFFKVYDGFPDFVGDIWRHKTRLTTVPGHAKHVWINFRDDLFYTVDGGVNWTKVTSVKKTQSLAIGKQMTAGSYPTIFIYGKVNNDSVFGYYRSIDMGQTWSLIHDPNDRENWGGVRVMAADMEVEGRVYFSASGLGLIYGDDASLVSNCDDSNLLSNFSFENGFSDWEPRTGGTGVADFNVANSPVASEGSLSAQVNVTSLGVNYWDIQILSLIHI